MPPEIARTFGTRVSPSLRGSGLKFPVGELNSSVNAVSLFTREWIEIFVKLLYKVKALSPSLRGSGLK